MPLILNTFLVISCLNLLVSGVNGALRTIGKAGRIPGVTTNFRPAAAMLGDYWLRVCWNSKEQPNTIMCATNFLLDDFYDDWYLYGSPYISDGIGHTEKECDGINIVGGVALTGTVGLPGVTWIFYMYGRSNKNDVIGVPWNYLKDRTECPGKHRWEDMPCYNADPSALFVKRGSTSFVLVLTQTEQGYMFMAKDSYQFNRSSVKIVQDVNGNRIRMNSSASLVRDTNDTVAVYFTAYELDVTAPPQVWRTTYNIANDTWAIPLQVHSSKEAYLPSAFPWLARVARDVDPNVATGSQIMMWPKDWSAVVTDVSTPNTTIWANHGEDDNDEPGSSCSELIQFDYARRNERWTLCFYRGANEDGIWYTGYGMEIPASVQSSSSTGSSLNVSSTGSVNVSSTGPFVDVSSSVPDVDVSSSGSDDVSSSGTNVSETSSTGSV